MLASNKKLSYIYDKVINFSNKYFKIKHFALFFNIIFN